MNSTGNAELPDVILSRLARSTPDSEKPVNRKSRNFSGRGVRLKREGAPAAKRRSRPETPLLKWKFDKDVEFESDRGNGRKVSARELAAGLWRLQPPEGSVNGGGEFASVSKSNRFGFQPTVDYSWILSPASSASGSRNRFVHKLESKLHFSNSAMEGATKWDPGSWKASKRVDNNVSVLESELEQARARINELETKRQSSKKKLEQFLKKLSEWRRREHEKIWAVVGDAKLELKKERKNRQRTETVNSKLMSELTELRLSGKRYLRDYEKERKARELIEEVCDELAKEIREDKAEIEYLKRESMKKREEVDDERRMLQMAEVWREERMQMKLVDAKVMLEEKYSYMNKLVEDLEAFLISKGVNLDSKEVKRAEILRGSAGSIDIREIGGFGYEPPNPDDDGDGDESGWETVSHVDDRGSSYSPDHGSGKSAVVSPDWGLEDGESRSPRVTRGVKGCIGWASGVVQNSLKAKLLEARMESQKVQLHQVMKQKI